MPQDQFEGCAPRHIMAMRVSTTANVLLRDLDTHGAEKVDTTASVAVKRKFGDTTCVWILHEYTLFAVPTLHPCIQCIQCMAMRHEDTLSLLSCNVQLLPPCYRVDHQEHQVAQWRPCADLKAPRYVPIPKVAQSSPFNAMNLIQGRKGKY